MADEPEDKAPHLQPGEIVPYHGHESNGRKGHPAIVTSVNDDGTVNAHVFFDGSPSAPRKGLVIDHDGLTEPLPKEAEPDGA